MLDLDMNAEEREALKAKVFVAGFDFSLYPELDVREQLRRGVEEELWPEKV